jgi:hypothetical protein
MVGALTTFFTFMGVLAILLIAGAYAVIYIEKNFTNNKEKHD